MIIRSICFEPTGPQAGGHRGVKRRAQSGQEISGQSPEFRCFSFKKRHIPCAERLVIQRHPSSQPKQDRVISFTRWVATVTRRVISVTRGGRRHYLLGNDHYPLGNHDYPLGSDTCPSGNRSYPLGGRRYPLGNDNSLPENHPHPRWCAQRGGQRTDILNQSRKLKAEINKSKLKC
jgi:hypothetical protein